MDTFHFGIEEEYFINKKNSKGQIISPTGEKVREAITLFSDAEQGRRYKSINGWTSWNEIGCTDWGSSPDFLEISSYPVKVQENCITELSNLLKKSRNLVFQIGKNIYKKRTDSKGWSTHYNFQIDILDGRRPFLMKEISPIPYYFLLNPWSVSLGQISEKIVGNSNRLQIACDFMNNIDQIEIGLAFVLAQIYSEKQQLIGLAQSPEKCANIIKKKGGEGLLDIGNKKISVFDYFQKAYSYFNEDLQFYGGKELCGKMEDFLNGKKRTRIDQFKEEPKTKSKRKWAEYEKHKSFYYIGGDYKNINPKISNQMIGLINSGEVLKISWQGVNLNCGKRLSFSDIQSKKLEELLPNAEQIIDRKNRTIEFLRRLFS